MSLTLCPVGEEPYSHVTVRSPFECHQAEASPESAWEPASPVLTSCAHLSPDLHSVASNSHHGCICTTCYAVLSHSVMSNCVPHGLYPPVSSVHGIFQETILEWVAISYSREYPQPRDWTHTSWAFNIGRQILYHCCHLGSSLCTMEVSKCYKSGFCLFWFCCLVSLSSEYDYWTFTSISLNSTVPTKTITK